VSLRGDILGPLAASDLGLGRRVLAERLEESGYLYLPGALDAGEVMEAREAIFSELSDVDEIELPPEEGIVTGRSRRDELHRDRGAFWKDVVDRPELRRVTNGPRLAEVMERVYGEPALAHDFLFLRAGPPGRETGLHYDWPFFARTSQRTLTCWIPLGPVPISDGPLVIVEGSNRFEDLVGPLKSFDIEEERRRGGDRQAEVSFDLEGFARSRKTRLLTTDFAAGDLLIFGMMTMHGALANRSSIGRARLSCDVRYQPASDPPDPRYQGADPRGTFGGGYAEVNGAKPLTEDWHHR
jgi:ectoine hydroxylase-related dioxygenase (phytanoyl-CoA dioxygenase family)